MNPLMIKGLAGLALAVALVAGYFAWHGHVFRQGEDSKQAEWTAAENAAILKRTEENKALAETQAETNRLITRSKDAEITKIRADLANAPRVRVGTAICGNGPAAGADTKSASLGDGADTGSRLVSESADRDIRALKLKVEEAFATGRACQSFITSNGLAP